MQHSGRKTPAYRRPLAALRSVIEEGRFGEGKRLPTKAEPGREHGVSRHTVRQAFRDLVADVLVYRLLGRGTFVTGLSRRGRYLRLMGTLEEVMSRPGTEMEVLDPVELREEPDAAGSLELPNSEEVAALVVRRLYEGLPFIVTHIYLPPQPGKRMREEGLPANGPGTVIGTIECFIPSLVAGAGQDIVAIPAPADVSATTDCRPGEAILRAERLYDANGTSVEFAVSHYNPRR